MDRNKRMIKTTLIYFIGNFGSKLLSFFLLPLYTSVLEPEQFGTVDLILSVIPLIGPVFTLQTTESIFRFLFNCKSEDDKKRAISSAFLIYLLGIVFFVICFIPYVILSNFSYAVIFGIYFAALYFGIFTQQILRGFQKNIHYAITGVISTFVQAIVNIALIYKLKESSLIIAPLVASVIISIYGVYQTKLWSYINVKYINKEELKKQLAYGIPLVPNQICWWFNGAVGKYIVNYFIGSSANGIIALATRFPNLVSVIMQIYFLAWTENSIFEINSEDREDYFSKNFNGLILFLIYGSAGLLLVIKIYMLLMVSDKYREADLIIPILVIAMIFNALATFLGTVYTASMKTKDAFSTTIYAAISNIICSFIFIPTVGICGYALANVCSYSIFLFTRLRSVRKIMNIYIYKRKLVLPIIILICSIFIYYFSNIFICFGTLIIGGILFIAYFKKNLWNYIKQIIK